MFVHSMDLLPPERSAREDEDDDANITHHTDISRVASNALSYNDFYWRYMHSNWPVLLTDVSVDWKCRREWTLPPPFPHDVTDNCHSQRRSLSAINFDYLRRHLDNCLVPVADCGTTHYNSHAKSEMLFHDFLQHWEAKVRTDQAEEENSNFSTNTITTEKNLYLKDWHLASQLRDDSFYDVPVHFAADWLNERLVHLGCDDYRFVYMGPKDSWTPFHADVFGSYSWSTNIAGCKKWILLPPGEELKLADRLGNLPFSIDDETLLQQKHVRFFTLLQCENEALFVPSGWYHQVWNLSDTISVNHNWYNACNIKQIWRNLQSNMQKVRAEIDDCRQMDNFDEHCQTMLRASFGINYLDFLDALEFIAGQRLMCFENGNGGEPVAICQAGSPSSITSTPTEFHLRHDLCTIRVLLELMLQDGVICDSRAVLYRRCLELLESLKGF